MKNTEQKLLEYVEESINKNKLSFEERIYYINLLVKENSNIYEKEYMKIYFSYLVDILLLE
jgi:hypothetical protein